VSFSRLLLVCANSKKYIQGHGKDKVYISAKISTHGRDAYEGEVILCFQLDEVTDREKLVARSLGIPANNKRCDGLVFYSQDEKPDRVICLVEMKSTNVADAANQIISTKRHIEELLQKECNSLAEGYRSDCMSQIARITWKACLYHSSSSPNKITEIQKELLNHGFNDIGNLTTADNDLRPLLTSEGRSAKDIVKKIKSGRKR
jgi:hypothetical protein